MTAPAPRSDDEIRADLRALLDEAFPVDRDDEPNAADLAAGVEWWARTGIWWASRCRQAWADRDAAWSALAAAEARLAEVEAERDAAKVEAERARWQPLGDNHHNAGACPHCTATVANERDAAEARAVKAEQALAHADKCLRDYMRIGTVEQFAAAQVAVARVEKLREEDSWVIAEFADGEVKRRVPLVGVDQITAALAEPVTDTTEDGAR